MWLIPKPICHCSPASEGSTWDLESRAQMFAASVTARGITRPAKHWLAAWRKAPSTSRQYLQTFEPSRANSIVEEWLESWPVSPARITRLLEGAPASSESTGSFGTNSPEPFASWDQTGLCWRTSQESMFPIPQAMAPYFQPDSTLFLETWPVSGSMRNGCVYEHPEWEPATAGPGGSALPTARAEDSESCGNHPGAITQAENWASPAAHDGRRPGVDHASTNRMNLNRDAANWGTPTSRDWKDGTSVDCEAPTNGLLGRQVIRNWPTPNTNPEAPNNGKMRENGRTAQRVTDQCLATVADKVGNWTTVTAHDCHERHQMHSQGGNPITNQVQNFLSSPQDPEPSTTGVICWCGVLSCGQQSHRRRLNPLFVIWMMGWPAHWLAPGPISYGRAETELYLSRLRWQLRFLAGES